MIHLCSIFGHKISFNSGSEKWKNFRAAIPTICYSHFRKASNWIIVINYWYSVFYALVNFFSFWFIIKVTKILRLFLPTFMNSPFSITFSFMSRHWYTIIDISFFIHCSLIFSRSYFARSSLSFLFTHVHCLLPF